MSSGNNEGAKSLAEALNLAFKSQQQSAPIHRARRRRITKLPLKPLGKPHDGIVTAVASDNATKRKNRKAQIPNLNDKRPNKNDLNTKVPRRQSTHPVQESPYTVVRHAADDQKCDVVPANILILPQPENADEMNYFVGDQEMEFTELTNVEFAHIDLDAFLGDTPPELSESTPENLTSQFCSPGGVESHFRPATYDDSAQATILDEVFEQFMNSPEHSPCAIPDLVAMPESIDSTNISEGRLLQPGQQQPPCPPNLPLPKFAELEANSPDAVLERTGSQSIVPLSHPPVPVSEPNLHSMELISPASLYRSHLEVHERHIRAHRVRIKHILRVLAQMKSTKHCLRKELQARS